MWNLPPMKPDGIILYLRKSRTDDPILSVEEVLAKHEQMLDEWVERNLPGLGRVPEENRYREVVSGETLDSRPKVQEVLRRIESPRIKAVLIVEPAAFEPRRSGGHWPPGEAAALLQHSGPHAAIQL